MAKFIEMDDYVKFLSQLEEDVGPIVFVNKFTVNPEETDEFLKAWEADASYFKGQPGLAFQLSSIRVLVVVGHSLIMQFGSLLHS